MEAGKRRMYMRWYHMMERCYDKNRKDYKYYGARGVGVSMEWHEFSRFSEWLESSLEFYSKCFGYDPDLLVVDRIDSTGDYSSYNCHLTTVAENSRRAIKFRDSNGRFASWSRE